MHLLTWVFVDFEKKERTLKRHTYLIPTNDQILLSYSQFVDCRQTLMSFCWFIQTIFDHTGSRWARWQDGGWGGDCGLPRLWLLPWAMVPHRFRPPHRQHQPLQSAGEQVLLELPWPLNGNCTGLYIGTSHKLNVGCGWSGWDNNWFHYISL